MDKDEEQQIKVLNTYRLLIQAILLDHLFSLLFVFVVSFACVLATIRKMVTMSHFRYTAKTTLIYYPKRTSKIGSIDENQVLRIFKRNAMQTKLTESMNLESRGRGATDYSVEIRLDWKQKNLFNIESHSSNRDNAINAANLMAELCIKEYVAFRVEDLGKWSETVNTRKKELSESIKKLEDELAELSRDAEVSDPEQELSRYKTALAHLKSTRTDLMVQLSNAKTNQSSLELLLKGIDENALMNISQLREFESSIKKCEEEIATLSNVFTEKNPKMRGVIEKRDALLEEYNKFLKEKNIKNFNLDVLAKAWELQGKVREVLLNINVLNERLAIVDSEIKANEDMVKKLVSIIPHVTQLSHDKSSLQSTLKDLDTDSSAINYLLAAVKNDISQVEHCENATAQNPFSVSNLCLAVIAAFGCTFIAASLLSLFGFIWGNVVSLSELQAYPELHALGAIPKSLKSFTEASKDEMTVLASIHYNFLKVEFPKKVIFIGKMPGAEFTSAVKEGMNWSCKMSGMKYLHLKIVGSNEFTEPDNPDIKMLGATYYHGEEGVLPAANPLALSQSELNLLQSDIEELQNEVDTIFIYTDMAIDRFGVFFNQMLSICDSAMIIVGARRSSRSLLRYIVNQQHESGRCIMSILTDSNDSMPTKR